MHILLFTEVTLPKNLLTVLKDCGIDVGVCEKMSEVAPRIQRDHPAGILAYKPGPAILPWLRSLAQTAQIPIFVVSGHASLLDRVNALKSGVSQYYIEPFSYTRLVFDLGSVRYATEAKSKHIGQFAVNLEARSITFKGRYLALSQKQYQLLSFLLARPNQVFSRTQIWEEVWGLNEYPSTNSVDALVSRTRRRLPRDSRAVIEQVYGIGYRLVLR